MAPAGIPLLLFVVLVGSYTGSTKATITVSEETKTTNEGSCVTIPCVYKIPNGKKLDLLWFKNSQYNHDTQMFDGTIVYSNTEKRPQSPGYSGRVEYITNIESMTLHEQQTTNEIQCDLRITDLQKTDSGNYSFRYTGDPYSDPSKFMSNVMNLTVTDNPCRVYIEQSELKNPLKESNEFTVRCSTSGPCDSPPEWLHHKSEQKPEWTSSSLEEMIIETEEGKNGTKVTKLKLNVTWKDDNRILSCRPANSDDNCQIRNITLSVEYSPKDTHASVSSNDIKERDSVTLSCTSRGRPEVTYTWFKKNKGKPPQMSNLFLTPVKPEDSGEYYCEAKNSHGVKKSNEISINVKFGPKDVTVTSPDNIKDLKEGDTLTLKCSVKQHNPPAFRFVWYKNDQQQRETSGTFIDRKVTAAVQKYKCEADNGINKGISQVLTVDVKYSPRNITILGETSVKVDSTLKLICSADAHPQAVYKWTFPPGFPSFLSSSNSIETSRVTIKHAGEYTCSVKNAIGTKSQHTNVKVLYPPFNISLLMQSEVREFEVISIICTVQSFPKSEFTVTKNQDNLLNIPEYRRNSTESENKLTIFLNVTESDAGTYKCKARNDEGQKETNQKLTVLYAPKNVTASFKGDQKSASELTLTCEARSNPPVSSYEWTKLINGQFLTLKQHQQLHFHSLEISNSGQYVCIAHNTIGKAKSPPLDIRVKYIPNITVVHNTTASAQWDLPVYLSCIADAHPPATEYKWYRHEDNTTVLSQQQNFTVLPQNPGLYYCTATNNIGKSRSKQIALFVSSNSLRVFLKIVLPIIFLLILIVVVIFLIRRNIIKIRSDQQSGADNLLCLIPAFLSRSSRVQNLFLLGSRNNTQENLSLDDPNYAEVNLSYPIPPSQNPTQGEDLNARPKPNIQTVYAAVKLPQKKQERHSPKQQQKTGNMDNSSMNYVTLDFKGQNEPRKRTPETSVVYAMVSKNKQAKSPQAEHSDYENVSSACAPRLPLTNMEWESDTSEEEEVNYTTVSCSAKPAVKEVKHNQKRRFSSSSSDEDDRTEYSDIKT
ncbi:B-cell receptor CD22 [Danio aesculapii]|uniref:B-cell receptor CD22 n=1 Tax=Danio aesculapii TaxID=1142201 RepID=UPI0024C0E454|nr:B-cell receptor CD22 [Danio aesculapii]